MKKFAFQLNRVMDWRRSQARAEEINLERLHAELRAIDARDTSLKQERAESERTLLAGPMATGSELAALDAFQRYTEAERTRIGHTRADCSRRIGAQLEVVNVKRRNVRLLERLKERRLKTWIAQLGRETDQQADEAYLAKWNLR
jgi:flagellar biosynthesis chaperone FliJ